MRIEPLEQLAVFPHLARQGLRQDALLRTEVAAQETIELAVIGDEGREALGDLSPVGSKKRLSAAFKAACWVSIWARSCRSMSSSRARPTSASRLSRA